AGQARAYRRVAGGGHPFGSGDPTSGVEHEVYRDHAQAPVAAAQQVRGGLPGAALVVDGHVRHAVYAGVVDHHRGQAAGQDLVEVRVAVDEAVDDDPVDVGGPHRRQRRLVARG